MVSNKNIGIPLKMTGSIQAPFGYYEKLTNADRASLKGISNARDILEASKAAYGNFKNLQTLLEKNNIEHTNLRNVIRGLKRFGVKNMKIEIIAGNRQDISRLVRTVTWSGSMLQENWKLILRRMTAPLNVP